MRSSRLCLSLLPLIVAGCGPREAIATGAQGLDSVVLERTPCFGTCPAYRVVIARDGLVHFQSRDGQTPIIDAHGAVSPNVLDTIASRAERLDFFGLPAVIQNDRILCKD